MHRCTLATLASLLALSVPLAPRLGAQQIVCPQAPQTKPDTACALPIRAGHEIVLVRVLGAGGTPVARAKLRFRAARGAIDTASTTNAMGVAAANWYGDTLLTGPDTVVATLASGPVSAERRLVLTRPPAPSPVNIRQVMVWRQRRWPRSDSALVADGDNQTWYIDRQLGYDVPVEITGLAKPDDCTATVVVFRAIFEGGNTPDTVRGRMDQATGRCVASARWRLGKTVGKQNLRAALAGSPAKQVTFTAHARNLPWVAAGLAFTRQSGYETVAKSSSSVEVVVKTPEGDTTKTVTTTTRARSEIDTDWGFLPTLGVNTPIRTSWHSVRVSLAVDAQHLADTWFAGFSVPQLRRRLHYEDMNIDLHVVAQVSKRDILTNPETCAATPSACETKRKRRLAGVGAMVQLNATSFLTTVLGLFPK